MYGALHDGIFEGGIETIWGRFYVEAATKYFNHTTPFHSVLYSAEDVRFPAYDQNHAEQQGWCGVRGDTERWMNSVLETQDAQVAQVWASKLFSKGSELQNARIFIEARTESHINLTGGG